MSRILLIIALLMPCIASADSIYIGGWSAHFHDIDQRCERHDMLAYSVKGFTVGRFKNSYCAQTWIATKRLLKLYPADNIRAAIHAGVTYGYHSCSKGNEVTERIRKSWCPTASFEFAYTRHRVQPAVIVTGDAVMLTFNIQI